jgi:hypothetical protein
MSQAKQLKTDSPAGSRKGRSMQIEEDIPFQRRDWLAQRIGWGALAALLLAALLGLTGSGPLSHALESDGRGLSVDYERFVRHGARTALVIEVSPGTLSGEQARITLERDYLAAYDVQSMVPEPERMEVGGGDVTFVFTAGRRAALKWRMTLEPDELGRHGTSVRLDDGPPVEISQFTLP